MTSKQKTKDAIQVDKTHSIHSTLKLDFLCFMFQRLDNLIFHAYFVENFIFIATGARK